MREIAVVIVEDDPMVMEVNKQFLDATGGFRLVGTASSGTEALHIIKIKAPHLVILDNYLPDLTGVEVLVELRKQSHPVDVILVTAARDAHTVQSVMRYGAIDYIVKPFRFERFKAALDAYKKMRAKLSKAVLNQEDIDRFKKIQQSEPHDTELPKGLNPATLKQIYLYVCAQSKPSSAEEVAEGTGLARVTARRYLDYLEKINKVHLEVQYGTIGRPVNRYYIK
ncbi:response regulator [Ectobacillus antri]|jgi:two-component system response regulator DctR|uniref:Response regulator n=1 Tax=Ectobacillus antri TaxID=2486280 RepID=A0ABT6H6X2_9BACI|nr:response regulator [Ectobacillus antri]MDG4657366.1 response regulator [Ectobacillus antri]MDG5754503.1 response regulator [Ectobacillus antri]